MDKYLKRLIGQFKNATGTNNIDINSEEFIQEFRIWINERKSMEHRYSSFIEYMGVPSVISECSVEIGKGKFDSIALETTIPMITPYYEGITAIDNRIITADFIVYSGTPTILRHYKNRKQFEVVDTRYFKRFITQNPYEQSCISNWEQLHNRGHNITVGIFGSVYDKDIELKLKQIKTLSDKLNDNSYVEEYTTDADLYYYAISSTKKVKIKEKILTR